MQFPHVTNFASIPEAWLGIAEKSGTGPWPRSGPGSGLGPGLGWGLLACGLGKALLSVRNIGADPAFREAFENLLMSYFEEVKVD